MSIPVPKHFSPTAKASPMPDTPHSLRTGFFARHETFRPRYGWLKKGYDGIAGFGGVNGRPGFPGDDRIFDRPDAIEILGVGKNMVRSIRFWCAAFHLIAPADDPGSVRISGPMRTTPFGDALLADDGWDPYLEDPASLWLLHWRLFVPPVVAPAWSIAVSQAAPGGFSASDLARTIRNAVAEIPEHGRISASSFEKDASCFIRMYAPPRDGRDDEIECPFTHLDFLIPAEPKGCFRFNPADKPDLPDAIFLAACLDVARYRSARTLSLGTLAYDWNSPGRAFQLSETDIGNRLERATAGVDGAVFTESYGNRQLQLEADPAGLRASVLADYYGRRAAP